MTEAQKLDSESGVISDLKEIHTRVIEIDKLRGELAFERQILLQIANEAYELAQQIKSLGKPKDGMLTKDLDLPPGIKNALRALQLDTIGDIIHAGESFLRKTPTLDKAIDDIRTELTRHDFVLK